jgi:hypothetical protein
MKIPADHFGVSRGDASSGKCCVVASNTLGVRGAEVKALVDGAFSVACDAENMGCRMECERAAGGGAGWGGTVGIGIWRANIAEGRRALTSFATPIAARIMPMNPRELTAPCTSPPKGKERIKLKR